MGFRSTLWRVVGVMALAITMLATVAAPASAQTDNTISAELDRACAPSGDTYTATLQAGTSRVAAGWTPDSVKFTFADGSVVEAPLSYTFGSAARYTLADTGDAYSSRGGVTSITAQFDTQTYPDYRFFLTQGYPCTYTLTGTVLQFANQKPVAGAEVCLVEIDRCAVSDANGNFVIEHVTTGTYTMVSTAPVYKTTETTAVVKFTGGDVHVEVVQYRGID